MEDASKISPFVISTTLSTTDNDHIMAELHQSNRHSFRHWRGRYLPLPRAAVDPAHDSDPYLLVMLADQEFGAYRSEQAESLIEAAYEAYDQCRFGS
jgi:hypothetical protein